MKLDHMFVFLDDVGTAETTGERLQLTETYRRKHPGQGTTNICYCFENAYLELLVIEDETEAASPVIARTGLLERARWRALGTCPLGIAWRLDPGETLQSVPLWAFRPPYLPGNLEIPVAVESDDPTGPMLFQSPNVQAPADWPAEQRGVLQAPAELRRIAGVTLAYPVSFTPSAVLCGIAQKTGVKLIAGREQGWCLSLEVERDDGELGTLPVLGLKASVRSVKVREV